MGSLLKTAYSEVTATLERLDHFGATADDLREIRSNDNAAKAVVEAIQAITGNRYANEGVESSFTYPSDYTGHKSIREQVEALLAIPAFNDLDAIWVLDKGQAWYDELSLPDWVEGPLVYVWHEALGGYHATLEQVLKAIADSRTFYNYRTGQLTPSRLRQHARTVKMEKVIKAGQPGDLIIVPSQAGLRHRGRSVRRARVRFYEHEFGLGSVAEGCRVLSHPGRFIRWEQLQVDCAGDEFAPDAVGDFSSAPYLNFSGGRVRFDAGDVDLPDDHFGSASGFLPQ